MPNIGDNIIGNLGNLSFGGKIIMITDKELLIELPCGIYIRTKIVSHSDTGAK